MYYNASLNVAYWDFIFCRLSNKAIGAQWFEKPSLFCNRALKLALWHTYVLHIYYFARFECRYLRARKLISRARRLISASYLPEWCLDENISWEVVLNSPFQLHLCVTTTLFDLIYLPQDFILTIRKLQLKVTFNLSW